MNLVNCLKAIRNFEENHPHQVAKADFYRKSALKSLDWGVKYNEAAHAMCFHYIQKGEIVHKVAGDIVWFQENPSLDCPAEYPDEIVIKAEPFSVDDLLANDWEWEV